MWKFSWVITSDVLVYTLLQPTCGATMVVRGTEAGHPGPMSEWLFCLPGAAGSRDLGPLSSLWTSSWRNQEG